MSFTPSPESVPPALPVARARVSKFKASTLVATITVIALIVAVGFGATRVARASQDAVESDPALAATLREMQVSASIGDWRGFVSHIDVPSFRSSLVTGFQREQTAARGRGEVDGFEAALSSGLAAFLSEKLVTDQTLPEIMKWTAFAVALTDDGTKPTTQPKRSGYFVTSEMFVLVSEPSEGKASYFVFRKTSPGVWKLVGLSESKV